MAVITSKDKIVVEKTGHPAAMRKIRCPKCRRGYAVQSNVNSNQYTCNRCGLTVTQSSM